MSGGAGPTYPCAAAPRAAARAIARATCLFIGLALAWAFPLAAESPKPPVLGLPIDCSLGETCYVQNYVDRDPSPQARDVGCGHLTYDGHKGTDFALHTFAQMQDGVPVLAAADGVVIATRDGMPDLGLRGTPSEILARRDCGNGVLIDHGNGWQTQYCHLRKGSLRVSRDMRVERGDPIALVGFSGRTAFPHVHLSLRHDGQVIDPFDMAPPSACAGDNTPDAQAWAPPLPYVGSGIALIGVSDAVPTLDEIVAGDAGTNELAAGAPALVGWALIFGPTAGDQIELRLVRPDGAQFLLERAEFTRDQARAFRAMGRRLRDDLAAGTWQIEARLLRAGRPIDRRSATFKVSNNAP